VLGGRLRNGLRCGGLRLLLGGFVLPVLLLEWIGGGGGGGKGGKRVGTFASI